MFRELTRQKQQLSAEACLSLLKGTLRGVLSVQGDDGYPYALPMNHYYNEDDGKLYFHSGKFGHKVDALRRCDKVSFCVQDAGTRKPGDWFLTFQSVIVFGRIHFIEDTDAVYDISRRLSRKFTDDEAYIQHEIDRSGPGTLMFALTPEQICGKLVKER